MNANNPLGTGADNCTNGGLQISTSSNETPSTEGCCVISVNGKNGVVVLATGDIQESGSNLYFTNTRARLAISGEDPITYNNTTGVIGHANKAGLVPAVYGSTVKIPKLTIDAKGHISAVEEMDAAAATLPVKLAAINALAGFGYVTQIGPDTYALRGINGTVGRINSIRPTGTTGSTQIDLAEIGVGLTPGTYGTALKVARVTVDAYGRVTAVSEVDITFPDADSPSLTLGELTNVADGSDAPGTVGMVLTWNGTAWLPIAPPSLTGIFDFTKDVVTGVDTAQIAVCGASLSSVNGIAKITHTSGAILATINTVLYRTAPVGPDLVGNLKIGQLPAGYFPKQRTSLPVSTIITSNSYKTVDDDFINGQQVLLVCTAHLELDGGIYVSYLKGVYAWPTADSLDIIQFAITGSYYVKDVIL